MLGETATRNTMRIKTINMTSRKTEKLGTLDYNGNNIL